MISLRQVKYGLVGVLFCLFGLQAFAADSAKAQLQTLVPQVKSIAAQSDVVSAVTSANAAHANLSKTDVRNLGRQWHDGLSGKSSDILNQVNSSSLSADLKTIVAQSNGAYQGILVTDSKGLVIAQTYNADRYSQARRGIWSKIPKDGVNATYFGKPKQVDGTTVAPLGLPVVDNNQVIGAIIVNAKVNAAVPATKKAHG